MNELGSGWIKIPEGSIILRGRTGGSLGEHEYIVYVSGDRSYHVNSDFKKGERHTYIVNMHSDRKIAENDEEYRSLFPSDIEYMAYGAYMDGAR